MRRRGNKTGTIALLGLFIAIIVGAFFLANSPMFERKAPQIDTPVSRFWNLKTPLRITLKDASGIKSYKVVLNDGKDDFIVLQGALQKPEKKIVLNVKLPRAGWNRRVSNAVMRVYATDGSSWNFFRGNSAEKTTHISIDTQRPFVSVLTNSYKITKGGSALVVFKAKDNNLKSVTVHTSFGKIFKAEPFYKQGYYASLIAWPVTKSNFRAWVEAKDLADNISKAHVPLYLKNYKYKRSIIRLKDNFLNGKVADLANNYDVSANITDPVKRFKAVNETIRGANEKKIYTLSSKVSDTLIRRWNIKPFHPLIDAAKVASFGDHRFDYYKGKLISESYHMGIDLASVANAPIRASNPGVVVSASDNGIYGNMPMLDHGMGLYTIYGHCSTILVHKGDEVARGETIAKTGKSGLALGDHLHFEILVQGVPVRPVEWMDAHWIKDNITDIFRQAIKMIKSQQ